jgi:Predicted nucleotide-binding protein containing TIR-like domain
VSSAKLESSDQTPDELGKKLLNYRHDLRRLTAEPPGQLLESIASKMAECDLFIFDLTDYRLLAEERSGSVALNQNVLLEVGIAFGMNIARRRQKLSPIPVVLVQLDHKDVRQPSDLEGISVFRYRLRHPAIGSDSGPSRFVLEYPCALRNTLREAIRAAVLKRSDRSPK